MKGNKIATLALAVFIIMAVSIQLVGALTELETPQVITLNISDNGDFSINDFGLSAFAYENGSLYFTGSVLFQGTGPVSNMQMTVETSGSSSNGYSFADLNASVDSNYKAFNVINGQKDLVMSVFNVLPESTAAITSNEKEILCTLNLLDALNETKNYFFNTTSLDNVGMVGSLNFDFRVDSFVGNINQNRYFSVVLTGQASANTVSCDFSIPPGSNIITATSGNQNMVKDGVPYQVSTTASFVSPLQPIELNTYIQWTVPSNPAWPTIYPYSIILSVIISIAVGYGVRFSYDKIRQKSDEAKSAPVKEALTKRVNTHCNLLFLWLQGLCDQGMRGNEMKSRIQESIKALVESVGNLGKDVVSPELKKEIIELDRLMYIVINDFSMGKYYPDEEWLKDIKNAAKQLSIIFGLIGEEVTKTFVEVRFDIEDS